jgi:hypothetical protein
MRAVSNSTAFDIRDERKGMGELLTTSVLSRWAAEEPDRERIAEGSEA